MLRRVSSAIAAAVVALLVAGGFGAAKGMLERTYDPAPPDTGYESAWAGTATTLTVRYAGDTEVAVRLPAVVRFRDDDGHGATTVTAELHRVEPNVWRTTVVLPHPGRWEGLHQHGPPFALRVVPRDAQRPTAARWMALTDAVTGALAAAFVRR